MQRHIWTIDHHDNVKPKYCWAHQLIYSLLVTVVKNIFTCALSCYGFLIYSLRLNIYKFVSLLYILSNVELLQNCVNETTQFI